MTKYLKCTSKKCRKEWRRLKADQDYIAMKRGKHVDLYPVHCSVDDCHCIDFQGKNGWECDECGKHFCERHCDGVHLERYGHYNKFCAKCFNELDEESKKELKEELEEGRGWRKESKEK